MLKVFNVISLLFVFFTTAFAYYYSGKDWRGKINVITVKAPLFIFLIIVLIYSTRDLGLDLDNYKRFYYDANILGALADSSFDYEFELGWKAIIFTLRSYDLGFNWFLFISSFVPFFIIFFISIKKDVGRNVFLVIISFYMLFLFNSIDALRAYFSASIILLSIYFLSAKKHKIGIVCFLFSLLFHNSALVFIVFAFFIRFKMSLISWVLSSIVLSFIGMLFSFYFTGINFDSLAIERDGTLLSIIIWKVQYYMFHYNQVGYSFISQSQAVMHGIMNYSSLISFLLFGLLINSLKFEESFYKYLINIYLNSFLLYIFLFSFGSVALASRMLMILNLGVIFIMPHVMLSDFDSKVIYIRNIMYITITINLVTMVLYQAGLHHPMSPFFIGF